jgi:hypothetical protein
MSPDAFYGESDANPITLFGNEHLILKQNKEID